MALYFQKVAPEESLRSLKNGINKRCERRDFGQEDEDRHQYQDDEDRCQNVFLPFPDKSRKVPDCN